MRSRFYQEVFLALAMTAPCVLAQEDDPAAATRAMVEGEAKFCQAAQEKGTRAAFLEFLSEDAIVFQPGPVNGKQAWGKRPATGLVLIWQPAFAAMSRSCDLGYTTGPSEWKKSKEAPLGYGQFVSIWKRQKDGSWKVALDVGTENPKPVSPPLPPELSFSAQDVGAKAELSSERRKLREAETDFANTAKTDSIAALLAAASDSIRVHREGVFPCFGKDAAALMLSGKRGKLLLSPAGNDLSAAGDLAYGYGKYSITRSESSERGHYLQIWRMDENGSWKVALDYQKKLPVEGNKPAG